MRLRVGTGLDLVHLTPQPGTMDPPAMLTPARWSTSLIVTASVGADLRLGPRFRLGLTAFVDVLPTAVHYDLANPDGQVTPLFSAARVRPGLALELAAAVL